MGSETRKPNEVLRRQRLLRGWSQQKVAQQVGTSVDMVCRWESGSKKTGPFYQEKLCELFEMNAEQLGFMSEPPVTKEAGKARIDTVRENVSELSLPPPSVSQEETHSHFSQAIKQGIIEAIHELEGTTDLDISRRRLLQQTLPLLLGATGSLLETPAMSIQPSTTNEVVSFYSTAIPACWSLVYNGGIEYVEKVLPTYLTYLTTIAQESSQYRQQAAAFASQGYKLANLLDLRREDFGMALQHSNDALTYGKIADDPNLQVAALIEEALTFQYRKRLPQTLAAYQKALQLADHAKGVSPIIKGRVYTGLAVAHARLGHEQEALLYKGLANDTFPDHPENDPHFSYTHYSHYYLYLYEGIMYTELGQPENALAAYTHFHEPEYVSRRTEIANKEAEALLNLGDLDRCCAQIETAVTLAFSTKSDLRYSQAREIYQGMRIKWPHEQNIKDLAQIFQG